MGPIQVEKGLRRKNSGLLSDTCYGSRGDFMRRAQYIGFLGLLGLALGFFLVSHRTRAFVTEPPAQLQAEGGVPAWPWLPGGINWNHGAFSSLPYSVTTVKDPMLPAGQNMVLEPGREGTVLTLSGARATVRSAAAATIEQGTARVENLVVKGVTYHYDRVMAMMTTAYNASYAMNGPSGAVAAWDGKPLVPGDVAVDPSVIALGTYLYVDGYGPARAVDTGSLILGDHIDLFFNESALRVALYGVQFHKVYVLTTPPPNFPG